MKQASIEQGFSIGRPGAELARFVSHYWLSLNNTESIYRALPDGCVDIVLEATPRSLQGWVYGTTTRPTDIACLPGGHYLGIRFRPGQSRHFIRAAAQELTDGREDLQPLFPFSAERISASIAEGHPFPGLDRALLARLRKFPPRRNYIDEVVRWVEESHGCIRISDAAARVGRSRRQLERAFLQAVGVPFKLYCRIARIKQAACLIASPLQRELVDIAIDAGYSDQSHMTRDFAELAGTSPGRLRQNDVAFFQYHASR